LAGMTAAVNILFTMIALDQGMMELRPEMSR